MMYSMAVNPTDHIISSPSSSMCISQKKTFKYICVCVSSSVMSDSL